MGESRLERQQQCGRLRAHQRRLQAREFLSSANERGGHATTRLQEERVGAGRLGSEQCRRCGSSGNANASSGFVRLGQKSACFQKRRHLQARQRSRQGGIACICRATAFATVTASVSSASSAFESTTTEANSKCDTSSSGWSCSASASTSTVGA